MLKKLTCLALALVLLAGLLPGLSQSTALAAVDINASNVFVKQATATQCTLASNVNMLRRRTLLDGNGNWSNITSTTLGKTTWGSAGMSFSYTYSGMKVYSYGMSSELGYKLGDVAGKKAYFIKQLASHPEGIVIYFHSNYKKHAVLLTDYDSKTDTFYCSDPAGSVSGGRIALTKSLLPSYIKQSGYSKTGLKDQDLVIGYIKQTWMIIQNTNTAVTMAKPANPSGLKAVKASSNTAKISWNAVSGATSYEVQYYSVSGKTWKSDWDYKTKTATSYTSTGLGLYSSYKYRVRAVNAAGTSGWTEITYTK